MKKALAGLLVASAILGASSAALAAAPVGVPTIKILDTSPTTITQTKDSIMQNLKSFVLDKLASVAAKQILHQMTVSVINWINSGFKGKPAFLTNPSGFFLDTADQITGAFLAQNGPLRKLCSPWSADIRLGIAFNQLQYGGGISSQRYTCTLGSAINNFQGVGVGVNVTGLAGNSIKGFVGGDFKQGGWPAYIALTTENQNNPWGTYYQALSDQQYAVGQQKSVISADLQMGNGFLSWDDCQPLSDEAQYQIARGADAGSVADLGPDTTLKQGKDGSYEQCTTKTPGKVIADSLHDQIQSPVVELELANDINSVVNALVSQLVTMTLQKGLYALNSGGSSQNGRAYLTQIYNDATASQTVNAPAGGLTTDQLTSAQASYDQAITLVTGAKNAYLAARTCFLNKESIPSKASAAASNASLIDQAISTNVDPLLSDLQSARAAIANQLTASQSTSSGSATVQGSSDASAITVNVQHSIGSYLDSVSTYDPTGGSGASSGTNANSAVRNSSSVLTSAQDQAKTMNQDALTFQTSCNSL